MRQGELLGLKWDSVNFDNKIIYVQKAIRRSNGGELENLKNSSSYRSISVGDNLYEELKRHRKRQNKIKLRVGSDYVRWSRICYRD